MKEPNLVADCLSKMQASTNLPVTIKTRIGYDNVEDYENLHNFITTLKSTGVKTFIIHARKLINIIKIQVYNLTLNSKFPSSYVDWKGNKIKEKIIF